SNPRIQAAQKFLEKRHKEKLSERSADEKFEYLRKLEHAVTQSVKLTAIEVSNQEEAYQIFETLNDRGLKLSPADLLLNFLLSLGNDDEARERIRDNWNQMIRKLDRREP